MQFFMYCRRGNKHFGPSKDGDDAVYEEGNEVNGVVFCARVGIFPL